MERVLKGLKCEEQNEELERNGKHILLVAYTLYNTVPCKNLKILTKTLIYMHTYAYLIIFVFKVLINDD